MPPRNMKDEVAAIQEFAMIREDLSDHALTKRIVANDWYTGIGEDRSRRANGNGQRSYYSILSVIRRYRAKQLQVA